ncbi:MAG: hypothetical protein LBT55_07415 [Clostridiaceae bacterium]|nr:hypothetical protein [Clostridiaceae bacterium]
MKENLWAGAVLASYTTIPRLIKVIDKAIKIRIQSGFMSKHLHHGVSTEELLFSISALNARKVTALNVHVLAEMIMARLTKGEALLAKMRYFERKPHYEIALILKCSLRTVFRWQDKLLQSAARIATEAGHGESWFYEECAGDTFFAAVLQRLACGTDLSVLP